MAQGDAALLAKALERGSKDQAKAVAAANRKTGRHVRDWTRDAARSGTDQQRKMAGGIGTRASKSDVRLTVKNTKGAPGATSAFYGQKGKFGWYGKPQYRDSPPQGPQWVGNSWTVAVKGQGPHVINDVLAEREPEISDLYLTEAFNALTDPIPNRMIR